jgi:hypothetical protein
MLQSQAARTTLLKSMANAIPTYLMSLFLIPKSFCLEIIVIMRKFRWGFPQDKKLLVCNWPHFDWTKSLVCKDTF